MWSVIPRLRKPSNDNNRTDAVESEPDASRTKNFIGKYRKRLTGWQVSVLSFAIFASVIFVINLAVTIWISVYSHDQRFLEGDCEHIKRLNSGLHVLLNGLSSVILSGSNYCMQILNAPTRKEIDAAHANGEWLDIGIPSMRNLRHVNKRAKTLWALLLLSTLPLHLFYNSAVIASLPSNDFQAVLVNEDFLSGPSPWYGLDSNDTNDFQIWNVSSLDQYGYQSYKDGSMSPIYSSSFQPHLVSDFDIIEFYRQEYLNRSLVRLENADCMQAYSKFVQSTNRNVFLVSEGNTTSPLLNASSDRSMVNAVFTSTDMHITFGLVDGSSYWICFDQAGMQHHCSESVSRGELSADEWRILDLPIRYCLSEQVDRHCKLRFNQTVMIIVTVLNSVKACIMFFVFFVRKRKAPILNIGDAISTFLEHPEPLTAQMCLVPLHRFRKISRQLEPQPWTNRRYRFKDVISNRRRLTMLTILLSGVVSGVVAFVLIIDSRGTVEERTLKYLLSSGFGTLSPRTVGGLIFPTTFLGNVVVANLPQVLVSICYFSYNTVLTSMCMGHEWSTYAVKHQGLRVSQRPKGQQRSTYFLQLPYRFGVPLLVASGMLHWLLSSSLFVVYIDFYDNTGRAWKGRCDHDQDQCLEAFVTCGYSPIAIFTATLLGSLMIVAVVGIAYPPQKASAVVVGTNSMAISAACHGKETEVHQSDTPVSQRKLRWGVTSTDEEEVGHCSFSAGVVETPKIKTLYA